jgi:hypothetical protein
MLPSVKDTLIPNFIQQINNDVGFANAQSVEILPHG